MQVHREINKIPAIPHAVLTIGTFDGVHLGHRVILHRIAALAKEHAGESVIITFYPHPRNVIHPDHPVPMLTTLDEKLALLEALQIDHVVVVPFSREFSEMDPGEYVREFLIRNFHPEVIVIGHDHKFGKERGGDIRMMEEIAKENHILLEEIPAQMIRDITISSTKIRNSLLQGNVTRAAELLGYRYRLSGLVIKGDQIGRGLGFPTANLHTDDEGKLIPGDGIYAVYATLKNERYHALVNIGYRPTFGGKDRRIEVYILDFNKDIYGEKLNLEFVEFIRGEEKFDSPEALVDAMRGDREKAERIFSLHT